ncbi:hypothetical protein BC938DRAFT_473664 [Jimgerdemannia flammicorona]|uniref:Uncharacterized protein n=1 Tax=Jimgerdemannia flammicorona TaxID=994334 RepID=A0A433QT57_9FUNG|nr:hypothetical protein BC938DRAFT_473664 [Jimgerdemannia flammicorona]
MTIQVQHLAQPTFSNEGVIRSRQEFERYQRARRFYATPTSTEYQLLLSSVNHSTRSTTGGRAPLLDVYLWHVFQYLYPKIRRNNDVDNSAKTCCLHSHPVARPDVLWSCLERWTVPC